eukprot:gene5898-biopygen2808
MRWRPRFCAPEMRHLALTSLIWLWLFGSPTLVGSDLARFSGRPTRDTCGGRRVRGRRVIRPVARTMTETSRGKAVSHVGWLHCTCSMSTEQRSAAPPLWGKYGEKARFGHSERLIGAPGCRTLEPCSRRVLSPKYGQIASFGRTGRGVRGGGLVWTNWCPTSAPNTNDYTWNWSYGVRTPYVYVWCGNDGGRGAHDRTDVGRPRAI